MSHLSTNTSQHKRHVIPQQTAFRSWDSACWIPSKSPLNLIIFLMANTSLITSLHKSHHKLLLTQGSMRQRWQGIVSWSSKPVKASLTHSPADVHQNCFLRTSRGQIEYLVLQAVWGDFLFIPWPEHLNCSRRDCRCSKHHKKQKARKPFLCCQNNLDLRNIL